MINKPLITPAVLLDQLEITDEIDSFIQKSKTQIANILSKTDSRKIIIIGPSVFISSNNILEYAYKLKYLSQELDDRYFIIMKLPIKWLGIDSCNIDSHNIDNHNIDRLDNINLALYQIRKLLLNINNLGVPCGMEFLDILHSLYFSDLISWSTSNENSKLASTLSMPIGLINSSYGYIESTIKAIMDSHRQHKIMHVNKYGTLSLMVSQGNIFTHLVINGGTKTGPNYTKEFIDNYYQQLCNSNINLGLIVDCRSQKNDLKQIDVYYYITHVIEQHPVISGLILESNITEDLTKLNWNQTYQLLIEEFNIYPITIHSVNSDNLYEAIINNDISNRKAYNVLLGTKPYYCILLPFTVIDDIIIPYSQELINNINQRLIKIPLDSATTILESIDLYLKVSDESETRRQLLINVYGMHYIPIDCNYLLGIVIEIMPTLQQTKIIAQKVYDISN